MKVEVSVWEVKKREITKLKHDDDIFTSQQPQTSQPTISQYYHCGKKNYYTTDEDEYILKYHADKSYEDISHTLGRTYDSVKTRYKLLQHHLQEGTLPRNWLEKDRYEFFKYNIENQQQPPQKVIEPRLTRVRNVILSRKSYDKGNFLYFIKHEPIYKNILEDIKTIMSCYGWKNRDIKDVLKKYYPNNKNNTLNVKSQTYQKYINFSANRK